LKIYLIARSQIITQTEKPERSEPVVDGNVDNPLVDEVLGPVETGIAAPDAECPTVDVDNDGEGRGWWLANLFFKQSKNYKNRKN
jgi:hypothetical protein